MPDQEAELTVIANDDLAFKLYVVKHITQLSSDVGTMKEDLHGNGEPGLIGRVGSLETARNRIYGIAAGIAFVAAALWRLVDYLIVRNVH